MKRVNGVSSIGSILLVFSLNLFIYPTTAMSKSHPEMELKIRKQQQLANLPSASGIEYCNGSFYVTGDNSPWLFTLDKHYEQTEKRQIYATTDLQGDTIPKLLKPDFEAMTGLPADHPYDFYIFGSGTKSPKRDLLVRISLASSVHDIVALDGFYQQLRSAAGLGAGDLNIEAAICVHDALFLFNRGKNQVVRFSLAEFDAFLSGACPQVNFSITAVELPVVNGVSAGFSGATFWPQQNAVLFTASVENTADWVADGEVLGSFIGFLSLADLSASPVIVPVSQEGLQLPVKLESIALLSAKKTKIRLVAVSDDDAGGSALMEIDLQLK